MKIHFMFFSRSKKNADRCIYQHFFRIRKILNFRQSADWSRLGARCRQSGEYWCRPNILAPGKMLVLAQRRIILFFGVWWYILKKKKLAHSPFSEFQEYILSIILYRRCCRRHSSLMGIQSSAYNSFFGPRQKSSGRLILLFQASFETLIFKQFSSGVGIITWGVGNMT